MADSKPKWKPSKAAIKYQKMKQRHEITVHAIDALKDNPKLLPYLIIVGSIVGGAAITAITAWLSGDKITGDATKYADKNGNLDLGKLFGDAFTAGLKGPLWTGLEHLTGSGSQTFMGFLATSCAGGLAGIAIADIMTQNIFAGGGGQGEGGGAAGLTKLLGVF